jgi:N utilization substance protein B
MGRRSDGPGRARAGATEGRSAARLAAVQALFQIEFLGAPPDQVIAEFEVHRLGGELDGQRLEPAEPGWFVRIVRGVCAERATLDERIGPRLAAGWSIEKLDGVLRAVLRAGTFELLFHPNVPARVIVSEYVDVAQAFLGARELGFVNAALEALAREARPQEFVEASGGGAAGAR